MTPTCEMKQQVARGCTQQRMPLILMKKDWLLEGDVFGMPDVMALFLWIALEQPMPKLSVS